MKYNSSPAELMFELFQISYDLNTDEGLQNMYSALLELSNPVYTNFIKLEYFRNCRGIVDRFQDIPEKYYATYNNERIFISHKWRTKKHPDPKRATIHKLLMLTSNFDNETAIWWDFCSLPQRNPKTGMDDRSKEQKEFFKFQLSLIPFIILDTRQMFLWKDEGLNSGWCCVETIISNLLMQDLNLLVNVGNSQLPPFFITHIENNKPTAIPSKNYERVYTTQIANKRLNEIMKWLKIRLSKFENTPDIDLLGDLSKDIIDEMLVHFKLKFTNGSDKSFVSDLLLTIFQRLKTKHISYTQLSGGENTLQMWHYVKGTYGNCVMPKFSYHF